MLIAPSSGDEGPRSLFSLKLVGDLLPPLSRSAGWPQKPFINTDCIWDIPAWNKAELGPKAATKNKRYFKWNAEQDKKCFFSQKCSKMQLIYNESLTPINPTIGKKIPLEIPFQFVKYLAKIQRILDVSNCSDKWALKFYVPTPKIIRIMQYKIIIINKVNVIFNCNIILRTKLIYVFCIPMCANNW